MLTNFKCGDEVVIVDSDEFPMPFLAMQEFKGTIVTLDKVNTDISFPRWTLKEISEYYWREEYLCELNIILEQVVKNIKTEIGL